MHQGLPARTCRLVGLDRPGIEPKRQIDLGFLSLRAATTSFKQEREDLGSYFANGSQLGKLLVRQVCVVRDLAPILLRAAKGGHLRLATGVCHRHPFPSSSRCECSRY